MAGLGAQKALISMAIINILGRDTDFSRILAGVLCLGMPIVADCTLNTLRYSISNTKLMSARDRRELLAQNTRLESLTTVSALHLLPAF